MTRDAWHVAAALIEAAGPKYVHRTCGGALGGVVPVIHPIHLIALEFRDIRLAVDAVDATGAAWARHAFRNIGELLAGAVPERTAGDFTLVLFDLLQAILAEAAGAEQDCAPWCVLVAGRVDADELASDRRAVIRGDLFDAVLEVEAAGAEIIPTVVPFVFAGGEFTQEHAAC